jgi:mRNA interferase MazF
MKRGEIWWARLPAPFGAAPGYKRPILVIQANAFNISHIATVITATITSNLVLAEAPGNVFIDTTDSGLPQPSVINISQIITLDRRLLEQKVKTIPGILMDKVDAGLKLVLALS